MKKAITHLKLNQANPGKLARLDQLAVEHQRVAQAYCDWLIAREIGRPNKYADLPEEEIPTSLSDRWGRSAWQQACGIVRSWYANERENRPVLHNVCIQANANVVKLERSRTPGFDYWLKISTLDKGHPIRIPLTLYRRAKEALQRYPKLCTGITLNKREGRWYATLVVEKPNGKPPAKGKAVGVDIGMKSIVVASTGGQYGQVSDELARRVEKGAAQFARKQKLNACLKRKGLPTVRLSHPRAEAFARNEIGRALNQLLENLPPDAPVAVERLSVRDMRMKSRQMNRRLRASQLGYIRDKLRFKLDEHGIRYRSVQAAYSSQQCSNCGFTLQMNRRSQAEFRCLWCGFEANADENAAQNIAERFGDDELNVLPLREVETVLAMRFMRRLSAACSAAAGLELQPIVRLPRGKPVEPIAPQVTVNQPGQHPCHSCPGVLRET